MILANIRVKSNANYTCKLCGSSNFIQAHHQIPGVDSTLIALCALCYSKQHPELPIALFFNKTHQPYWNNISAGELARLFHVHSRTIVRIAKKLDIPTGTLTGDSRNRIENAIQPHSDTPSKFLCNRCSYEWTSRFLKTPKYCPQCNSPYWNKERMTKIATLHVPTNTSTTKMTPTDISLLKLHCLRCLYDWWPRSEIPPKYCPRCNSPYWHKVRVKDKPVDALQDVIKENK